MDYLFCIPALEKASRENCEKIHNILARVSDKYKLKIVPEPAKTKQSASPAYYKKYRIYKELQEREGGGEAFLLKEEEEMILSVCRNPQEQELMKSCIYGYRYPSTVVLKSFRDEKKERRR